MTFAPLPPKDWAVDGSLGGTSRSRTVSSLGVGKVNRPGGGIPAHFEAVVPKQAAITAEEVRVETGFLDDAQHVVVAFGTPAKFVRYVVGQLRAEGVHVGFVRPISLWPFPYEAVAAAAEGVRSVMVFEINGGQMVDDVRLAVALPTPFQINAKTARPTASHSARFQSSSPASGTSCVFLSAGLQ